MADPGPRPEACDVVVVGGGASGLVAAIAARRAGAAVVLVERNPRVGKKLLTTGNHQCNLTNLDVRKDHYHGDPELAMRVIKSFSRERTLAFFSELGLDIIADQDGKVYPLSRQAGSVLDVLRFELERLGVEVLTDAEAVEVKSAGDIFRITLKNGKILTATKVIVCAGGKAVPATGSDGSGFRLAEALGHTLVEPFPALVQLKLEGTHHRAMEGMKWGAGLSLITNGATVAEQRGDILFTVYGLSGPAVLNVSRAAVEALREDMRVEMAINLVPELSELELCAKIRLRIQAQPERPLEEFFTGWLNKRIGQTLIKSLQLDRGKPWSSLTGEDMLRIAHRMGVWTFAVTGDTGWPNAQVTAGGVDTREVDPDTLGSTKIPGLYFAGEVLNVDGDSGGYNLQWAWSSGWVAGTAAAQLQV